MMPKFDQVIVPKNVRKEEAATWRIDTGIALENSKFRTFVEAQNLLIYLFGRVASP